MLLDKTKDVELKAGRTLDIRVFVRNVDGSIPNLAGLTARWWMGRNAQATGADIFVKKDVNSGVTVVITDPSKPYVLISLAEADTMNVEPGDWYHECVLFGPGASSAVVISGRFILKPSLVREPY